ncbi:uncharacterized protein LOC131683914 [Topomyia yanbarensis]|uniref:uncharacterized protein LOC131683914 n=1 Tax=Topomyia yanbarensis TaxID=2498891 RepID=UPI00273CBE2D|nr:uncharacterized protein LOC131683914 [Topomyia yanbarensis]
MNEQQVPVPARTPNEADEDVHSSANSGSAEQCAPVAAVTAVQTIHLVVCKLTSASPHISPTIKTKNVFKRVKPDDMDNVLKQLWTSSAPETSAIAAAATASSITAPHIG